MAQKEYLEPVDDVISSLGSSKDGLTEAEVQKRLAEYGRNKLEEKKKDGIVKQFLDKLKDPMLIILMIAAVLSVGTSYAAGEPEWSDAIIILIVVLINAVLGVVQESKAEKAIEALQNMSKAKSKVKRGGRIVTVESEELVPGDIIEVEAGDSVPADARIIYSASIKAEEAALTGESVPVDKVPDTLTGTEVPLGDRKNMLYMGSTVVYGRGEAVVTATGMKTEMGKIASALSDAADNQTPLQKKLNQLSKILTWLVLGICVFMFAVNLIRMSIQGDIHLAGVLDTFMIAVSLAVAAIPEGLAAVVTIVLSIGVTKMSRKNAIIRKLTAVETLGCTEVICSDKTGTLTQNKMTVVDSFGQDKALLAQAMALCSDAHLNEDLKAEGEPTEAALVNWACSMELNKDFLENGSYKRVAEAPFDSERKMMSTVHTDPAGGYVQYTKGAPDVLLSRCTAIFTPEGPRPLTDEDRKAILAKNKEFADKALRVLAGAMRKHDAVPSDASPAALEHDLVFIGLTGMIDPVRPEVKDAIRECRSAGIRPIMITGDHIDTAVAIGKELGIVESASEAITGAEIDKLSDDEFQKKIRKYSIYARVQPEHKVRIVKAWQKAGRITAMTGDGVNDAPSIKNADIGVGMGITGTDVTKNVADMVLADDNFATIVVAVEEGRKIYDNIRKAIQFLISSNLSEVIAVFVSSMMGITLLQPTHLLWINLITDAFPAVGLGMEHGDPDIMKRPPRSSSDGLFAGGMGFNCVLQGAALAIITIISYIVGEIFENGSFHFFTSSEDGMTMAFLTLSMAELFHSFNMRSLDKSLLKTPGHNRILYATLGGAFVLTLAVLYIPFLSNAFHFAHISLPEFLIALGLGFLIIPFVEIQKAIQRAMRKKNA